MGPAFRPGFHTHNHVGVVQKFSFRLTRSIEHKTNANFLSLSQIQIYQPHLFVADSG